MVENSYWSTFLNRAVQKNRLNRQPGRPPTQPASTHADLLSEAGQIGQVR